MNYQDFVTSYLREHAKNYARGLQQAGLEPTPILTKAIAERAVKEANRLYKKRYPYRYVGHLISDIVDHYGVRILGLQTSLAFGISSWRTFQQQSVLLAWLYLVGALVVLVMTLYRWHKGSGVTR